MINNIGGYKPSSAPRGASMVRANNRFGEMLAAKANRTDTFSRTSATNSDSGLQKFSSLKVTQGKLALLEKVFENVDYSDMSKAEIYADIENKFSEMFDDYFASKTAFCEDHYLINNLFEDMVEKFVGGRSEVTLELENEARGYSGMSYEEIESAIKEKYVGKTSFMDQLSLFGELFSSGVLHHKYGGETTFNMISDMYTALSIGCGGRACYTKGEMLAKWDTGESSSPFSVLFNCKYRPEAKKQYDSIVDDILFGII